MSKKDTSMAKLPGLHERAGVFQIRVMVPLDLQAHYGGRTKLVESLGTSNRAEANRIGTARRALRLAEFDEKRKQATPHRVDHVSPELGKLLAQRVAATVLGTDETLRGNPDAARLLVAALAPFKATKLQIGSFPAHRPAPALAGPSDPLAGLDAELAAELATLNTSMDIASATQMATQRVAAVLPLVKAEARAMGLEFDEKAPKAIDALRECLRAYRRAWQDVARRDHGEPVETPAAPQRRDALQTAPTKLRDVLSKWKASKQRRPATVQAAELALSLYEEATGNPPIATLTRSQGVDMRASLRASGVSDKTAHDRFNYIKGFLNFAARELELIPKNPWEGLAIEFTSKRRKPWTHEQVANLLALPLFTEYAIPKDFNAGADAAYWIPLLGLYSGARVSELAQLRVSDVEVRDGVPVVSISDDHSGQLVKADSSRRLVPVHSELLRLGFMEYVDAIRKRGEVSLWPSLPLLAGKPGNYFSDWFSVKVRKPAEPGALGLFHELRHATKTRLVQAKVDRAVVHALVGHEQVGEGDKTYLHLEVGDLRDGIEALRYPPVAALPRTFRTAAPTRVPRRLKG